MEFLTTHQYRGNSLSSELDACVIEFVAANGRIRGACIVGSREGQVGKGQVSS
jgi:hypothetical protein